MHYFSILVLLFILNCADRSFLESTENKNIMRFADDGSYDPINAESYFAGMTKITDRVTCTEDSNHGGPYMAWDRKQFICQSCMNNNVECDPDTNGNANCVAGTWWYDLVNSNHGLYGTCQCPYGYYYDLSAYLEFPVSDVLGDRLMRCKKEATITTCAQYLNPMAKAACETCGTNQHRWDYSQHTCFGPITEEIPAPVPTAQITPTAAALPENITITISPETGGEISLNSSDYYQGGRLTSKNQCDDEYDDDGVSGALQDISGSVVSGDNLERDRCKKCVEGDRDSRSANRIHGTYFKNGGEFQKCQCPIGYYLNNQDFLEILALTYTIGLFDDNSDENTCVREKVVTRCEDYKANPLTKQACEECDRRGFEWNFETFECNRNTNKIRYSSECNTLYNDKWRNRTDINPLKSLESCNNCVNSHGYWDFLSTNNQCSCPSSYGTRDGKCFQMERGMWNWRSAIAGTSGILADVINFVPGVTPFGSARNENNKPGNYINPVDATNSYPAQPLTSIAQCDNYYNTNSGDIVNLWNDPRKCHNCTASNGTWNAQSASCSCTTPGYGVNPFLADTCTQNLFSNTNDNTQNNIAPAITPTPVGGVVVAEEADPNMTTTPEEPVITVETVELLVIEQTESNGEDLEDSVRAR